MADATKKRDRASRWIWLSIAAAVLTIGLKSLAALVSGSVGFLSDAMESGVNLVAAVVTMFALRWSAEPPDDEHPFGHGKGELLAALLEGLLVFVAGIAIIVTSVERLIHPVEIASVPVAMALSIAATVVNGVVGVLLVRVGRECRSTALEADGHHLMTDVWTSVAVLLGVGLVALTKRSWLDPVTAALVALLVLRTGFLILRSAMGGLVDARLGEHEQSAVARALAPFRDDGVEFSAVRMRHAGRHTFVQLTVRVPGTWSVTRAHELADKVEQAVAAELELATVDTHVEPLRESKRSL